MQGILSFTVMIKWNFCVAVLPELLFCAVVSVLLEEAAGFCAVPSWLGVAAEGFGVSFGSS